MIWFKMKKGIKKIKKCERKKIWEYIYFFKNKSKLQFLLLKKAWIELLSTLILKSIFSYSKK